MIIKLVIVNVGKKTKVLSIEIRKGSKVITLIKKAGIDFDPDTQMICDYYPPAESINPDNAISIISKYKRIFIVPGNTYYILPRPETLA
ncbi:hypothetical protein KKF61_05445 [Patescibacteria group bacterium]|nr:hypothetical protein [Patescibacteria group bacterium]MBU0963555.1 hypothetical protein [Patescibacteria group bacterium]